MSRVYFVACEALNAVKIGVCQGELSRRIYDLQVGSAADLKLLCHVLDPERGERELHALFGPQRLRGEWFSYEGELRRFLDDLIGRYDTGEPWPREAPTGLSLLAAIGPLEFDPVEFEDQLFNRISA